MTLTILACWIIFFFLSFSVLSVLGFPSNDRSSHVFASTRKKKQFLFSYVGVKIVKIPLKCYGKLCNNRRRFFFFPFIFLFQFQFNQSSWKKSKNILSFVCKNKKANDCVSVRVCESVCAFYSTHVFVLYS